MSPTTKCTACQTRFLDDGPGQRLGLCARCRNTTGVSELPPRSPRPMVPCVHCSSTQFVRALLRERTEQPPNDPLAVGLAPMCVTFRTHAWDDAFHGRVISAQLGLPIGRLIAQICRGCGHTELFTEGFADLPIGPQYGTELVDVGPGGEGPYR